MLGVIDEAKVVAAGSLVLEGRREERRVELALDRVKVGALLLGGDWSVSGLLYSKGGGLTSVDRAERQTKQSVIVLVVDELLADLLRSFDGLAISLHAADSDGVLVDIAAGTAAVSVGDVPGVALHLLAAGGVVDCVTRLRGLSQFSREDPTDRVVSRTLVLGAVGTLQIR